MEKKYNPSDYNNAVQCEVCGQITYADDYGNTDKCPNCGWIGCADNERTDKTLGISYRERGSNIRRGKSLKRHSMTL